MTTSEKRKADLIEDLHRLIRSHGVMLDTYADEEDPQKITYKLKLVGIGHEDVYLTIEEAFGPGVYHGPPRTP